MIRTIKTFSNGELLAPDAGIAPAVVGIDAKYGHNAATMLRECAIFNVKQLWLTGDRWTEGWEDRMPREERMKAYQKVDVIRSEAPFYAFGPGITPVGVEITASSEPLATFVYPDNPVFVFGPEDGGLPKWARLNCHRFVVLPGNTCHNLAVACGIVLNDWHVKKQLAGTEPILPSYATLGEKQPRGWLDTDWRT